MSSSPKNFLCNIKKTNNKNYSYLVSNTDRDNKLNITLPPFTSEINSYFLDRRFLEWFAGFTDGEGNFHIRLTSASNTVVDKKNTTYKYVQFTFQIGLHKHELEVLEYIKNTLKCGQEGEHVHNLPFPSTSHNNLINSVAGKFNTRHTDFLYTLPRISFRCYSTTSGVPLDKGSEVIPVKKYINADTDKQDILKENANKAGVYR